jgi:hypothetical protein
MECNRTLAGLLGWTEIVELGGALLGMPPAGDPQCRGQAMVPDWHGDWRDCGPLISLIGIDVHCWGESVATNGLRVAYSSHASRDAALRHGLVKAAISALRIYGIEYFFLEKKIEVTP